MQRSLLISLMSLLLIVACRIPADAFSMYIYVENADYVSVSTARNQILPLYTGGNDIVLDDEDSPLTITPAEGCRITELVFDSSFAWPGTEPVSIPVGQDSSISIYCEGPAQYHNVTFSGDLDAFRAVAGPATLDNYGSNSVKHNELIGISPRAGYIITSVTTTPEIEVMGGGNQWMFFLPSDLNINVTAKEAPKGNVIVDIDDPANAYVITALGKVLALEPGENYVSIDVPTESPLSISPKPGAVIDVVANPTIINAGPDGVFTVPIDENAELTHLYVVTHRVVNNNLTINVNDASSLSLTDDLGNRILLSDGTNRLTFDFTGSDLLHARPLGDAHILKVIVDNVEQPIVDGGADFNIFRNSVVDIMLSTGSQEVGWISIVNEDFSGFPEGTVDQPDLKTPLLLEDNGNFIDESRLKPFDPNASKPWGGMNLYSAGGTLAVMDGFLNTPASDYSGKLRMTFRARLVPGWNAYDAQGIEVLLIRRSAIVDYKRQTFTLTPEWQTFTFEADNGWFHDTCIQFFAAEPVFYQLDDIRIDHRIVGIEPPKVLEPSDVTDNAFTANWQPTDTAEDYLLSVYTHEGVGEYENFTQDFESLETDADGHLIAMPEGWEFNLSASGTACEVNTNPAFADDAKSVCLDGNADYIQSPAAPRGISRLSYRLFADNSANGAAISNAVLNVGALTDGGWMPWLMQSVTNLINAGGSADVDVTEFLGLYDNIYAVRFELAKADDDKALLMIDNISYDVPGPMLLNYLWEDHLVEGPLASSCRVEDPDYDTDKDYYYHVKARSSSYVSEPSAEMEVFFAQTPVALPPTNVTESSFTANWSCGLKADEYDVTLFHTLVADQPMPAAVIISEDFSGVKSSATPEQPEVGQYTQGTVSLDQYTALPGWTATSYALSSGAVGGLPAADGYQVGGIISPAIDLSNNGGRCTLRLRAWFENGDAIQIQGNSAASYVAAAWNGTGWKDVEVELANCGNSEKITIWSGFGKPFMIDSFEILQDLQEGDRVDIATSVKRIEDSAVNSADFESVHPYGYSLGYEIETRRYYNGNRNDMYLSWPSERMPVELLNNSVSNVTDKPGLKIDVAPGQAIITLAEASLMEVYSLDGAKLAAVDAPAGTTTLSLPAGPCIIRAAARAVKALIP